MSVICLSTILLFQYGHNSLKTHHGNIMTKEHEAIFKHDMPSMAPTLFPDHAPTL